MIRAEQNFLGTSRTPCIAGNLFLDILSAMPKLVVIKEVGGKPALYSYY